jgi:formylglycine-generating enzyme required for sulfatase activity
VDELNSKLGPRLNPRDGLQYLWIPPPAGATREVRRGFWIGRTPVTAASYRRFAQETRRGLPDGQPDDHPVVNVSWRDAVAYCKWAGGRLPTEAEWEHAARAGASADPYGPLDDVAWYSENSSGSTHPVAQKTPNSWGLYDTLGNVWEWCEDRYGPTSE